MHSVRSGVVTVKFQSWLDSIDRETNINLSRLGFNPNSGAFPVLTSYDYTYMGLPGNSSTC